MFLYHLNLPATYLPKCHYTGDDDDDVRIEYAAFFYVRSCANLRLNEM